MINATRWARRVLARVLMPLFYLMPIARLSSLKLLVLRLHGVKVGENANVSPGLFVLNGFNFKLGRGSNLGVRVQIIDISPIEIGDNCLVSHGTIFISGTHETGGDFQPKDGPIVIGDRVWIGAGVVIVGPCTIGDGAIIGANSYVRSDVPPNSTCVGTPAKVIATRAPA